MPLSTFILKNILICIYNGLYIPNITLHLFAQSWFTFFSIFIQMVTILYNFTMNEKNGNFIKVIVDGENLKISFENLQDNFTQWF